MESGEFPAWLEVLLKDKFFNACLDHEDVKKNEKNILCIDCCLSICPHCLSSHTSHRLLQVSLFKKHKLFFFGFKICIFIEKNMNFICLWESFADKKIRI